MTHTDTRPAAPTRAPDRSLRCRWPAFAALALAALVALDLAGGADLAPVMAASGLVYLGAAALHRPAAAWPVFLGTFVVITAGERGALPFDAIWLLLALAGGFAGYGLLRGAARTAGDLPRQAAAMLAFGAVAVLTLTAPGDLGAYVVAAGLLGHAAWDAHHYRTGRVVTRSLAEFCLVLDTLLAAAVLVVALG